MDVKEKIKKILKEKLEATIVEIEDQSQLHAGHQEARRSGGGHYVLTVVSSHFEGKTPLQCHRMVYQALGDQMKKDIHALSIKALTS
ncbi:MAG: BolA family transcriptional regulator [Candidatus Omnitrophica bacterium]|nr:BolA family transcriptional regulator [Candidatus Omnitrophota bacterium]